MRPAKVCQSSEKTFWERSAGETSGLGRTRSSSPMTDSERPDAAASARTPAIQTAKSPPHSAPAASLTAP